MQYDNILSSIKESANDKMRREIQKAVKKVEDEKAVEIQMLKVGIGFKRIWGHRLQYCIIMGKHNSNPWRWQ